MKNYTKKEISKILGKKTFLRDWDKSEFYEGVFYCGNKDIELNDELNVFATRRLNYNYSLYISWLSDETREFMWSILYARDKKEIINKIQDILKDYKCEKK